ncbi:hypothetical protein [Sphingomonas sp. ABOLH]|uniref:hypothetical protein n=1 Tax=Sphingomonas sp. ABOLH TaxID=1985881 RepID=UPI000F7E7C42|nr:hypothetical protein [Sphingomonas sp. ABOLH]RSV32176.1 hypothetical protein CA237_03665 [Sphingomonas sp. ABOLH]
MASLSIEIARVGDPSAARPIGLVAEVSRIGDGGRTPPRKVSVSSVGARSVDGLAPGLWQIRLATPDGLLDTREVELAEGVPVAVRFKLAPRRRTSPAPPPKPTRPRRGPPGAAGATAARLTRRYSGAADGPSRAHDGLMVVETVATPAVDGNPLVLWRAMAAAAADGRLMRKLAGTVGPSSLLPEPSGPDDELRWRVIGEPGSRTYAVTGSRFHCLPVPWRAHDWQSPVALLLVGDAESARTRVFIEDEGFAGLLAYLSSGSVLSAVDLLRVDDGLADSVGRTAEDLLHGKRASPLGACAAGYALLGAAVPGVDEPWHPWIGNLSRWFGWIPDGAILLARLQLMQARSEADAAEALATLRTALGRGLPYYRRGFDWLLQAMLRFADDPVVAEVRPMVADVAARLDMREVFTTLTIGGVAR